MAENTKQLRIAISDADAGRITKQHLNDIFQEAIDNGDILSEENLCEENLFYVVSAVFPLIDQGLLRKSAHLKEFEYRINQRDRQHVARHKTAAETNPLREALADVDLNRLYQQYRGVPYARLVQQHLRRFGPKIEDTLAVCVQTFDDTENEVAEHVVDEYNTRGYDAKFWRCDCAQVFAEICISFAKGMTDRGLFTDDIAKFNMFQVVTLNFAYTARNQKELRRFAGIKKGLFFT